MPDMLPFTETCCTPDCDDAATTQIPGPAGADGADGTNGTDGQNAFTTLTAQFAMPAEAATVEAAVVNSDWAAVGQLLYVQNAGWMRVTAINDSTHLTLRNEEDTATSAYTENVAPATVVANGSKVCPGGLQGPAGSITGAFAVANNLSEGTPATMRSNLGLVIGTNVQAYNANLTTFAAIAPSANVQSVLSAANYAAIRTLLTLVPGTDIQAFDAFLLSIAALGTAADRMIYTTAVDTAAEATLTAAGRAILDDADAAAQRTTLGVQRTLQDYLFFEQQETSGTAGGDFTSGAWQTVPLNTEVQDTNTLGAIAANIITLQAGTYRFRGRVVGYQVDQFQARLYNVDTASVIATGSVAKSAAADASTADAHVSGRFTIAIATQIRLEARCTTTNAGDGFGIAASLGTEIYSALEFEREAG